MHTHGPSCLQGPVTRDSHWWGTSPSLVSQSRLTRSSLSDTSLGSGDGIRHHLVDRIRREIASGTYDAPEKFDAALDRLLERLEDQ